MEPVGSFFCKIIADKCNFFIEIVNKFYSQRMIPTILVHSGIFLNRKYVTTIKNNIFTTPH